MSQITDRAKRYRANTPECRPKGPKVCHWCKTGRARQYVPDHVDGDESNNSPKNLVWACKGCNTKRGKAMARAGKGVRTRQYNPSRRNYFEERIVKGSRVAVISANESSGPFTTRVFVDNGNVATLTVKKAKTIERARKQARQMLAGYGQNPAAPVTSTRMRVFLDPSIKQYAAHIFHPTYGNLVSVGSTKKQAATRLRDQLRDLRAGRRSHNPGANNLAQYVQAAMEHSRGAHDAGGKVIHETPKTKRQEFAREIWWRRGYRNPVSGQVWTPFDVVFRREGKIQTWHRFAPTVALATTMARQALGQEFPDRRYSLISVKPSFHDPRSNPQRRRNSVASTILEQLGGRRFSTMTGAKTFVSDRRSLRFRLPNNFARNGINLVRITLDQSDTYTVEFMKLRGTDVQTVSTRSHVYAEDLRKVFTSVTGLEASLGTMGNPELSAEEKREIASAWHGARIGGFTSFGDRIGYIKRQFEKTHPGRGMAAYKYAVHEFKGYGHNPPADVMPEFRAGRLRSSSGRIVRKKKTATAMLLSELRRAGRIPARSTNPNIVEAIRAGDRVTILTPHGNKLTGRAVMRSATGGWVLNLGGRHGTPGLADEENIVAVKPSKRNPDVSADALYKKFHGRGPARSKVYDVELVDPFQKYPELAQLGKLKSLTVGEFIEKMEGRTGDQPRGSGPDAWAVQIDFDENQPDVAAEPGGEQLFIVGGNQNVDRYLRDLRVDPGKDPSDLGFVYRIEYFTRKDFDQFRPVDYWHHFGEETHVQPRLVYDRANHRLQLIGGEYIVKREGIVN